MRVLIFTVGFGFLLINLVAYTIFPIYHSFNFVLVNCCIIYTFTFLFIVPNFGLKDAYEIIVILTLPLALIAKLLLAFYSQPFFAFNIIFLLILFISLSELLVFLAFVVFNKHA
jgi:hypothetical protein